MDLINIMKTINIRNNFLVVSNGIKEEIVTIKSQYEITNKELLKFNVITINELIDNLTFSIDSEAYLYNLEKFKRPISITKQMFEYSKYNLNNINEELNDFMVENENFIIRNQLFINNLNNYQFHIIGDDSLIKPLVKHYKMQVTNIELSGIKLPKVLKFLTKEEEVFYLFEQISHLLLQGNNINDIYIANVDNSYTNLINKLSSFYNIPFDLKATQSLFDIPYIKNIMNNSYDSIINLLANIELLKSTYKEERLFDIITFDSNINKLITVFNNYPHHNYSPNTALNIIIQALKDINVTSQTKLEDVVSLIKTDEIITLNDKAHVFILNTSYESFPKIVKDNSYLSDADKDIIGYPSSSILNISNNTYLEKIIKLKPVSYLSYSLRDNTNEYTASDITSKLIKETHITKISLSDINNGFANEYYKSHFSNKDEDIVTTTFTGEFILTPPEHKELVLALSQKDIKISPSQVTTYFQLPFVYYLERILGFNTFEKNINVNIGNFFHSLIEVLLLLKYEQKVDRRSLSGKSPFSYDEETHSLIFNYIIKKGSYMNDPFDYNLFFDEYVNIFFHREISFINIPKDHKLNKEEQLDIKTLFYVRKHKDTIIESLQFIVDLEEEVPSDELLIEKDIELINLKGQADLVKLYNDNTYSIIDYKTGGRTAFNKNNIIELISSLLLPNNEEIDLKTLSLLQLIFYAFFFYKSNPELELKDLAYFSYLDTPQSLNGITTNSSFDSSHYKRNTGGRRQITKEELATLFVNIEALLKATSININNLVFPITIRRDNKTKTGMDKQYYSVYEALAFFSDNITEGDEEDE